MSLSPEVSKAIVEKIVGDLTDRVGFRQIWDAIGKDIQQEIKEKWEGIIIELTS